MVEGPQVKRIEVTGRKMPPAWAVKQRYLIDWMDRLAGKFVEKHARPDGNRSPVVAAGPLRSGFSQTRAAPPRCAMSYNTNFPLI